VIALIKEMLHYSYWGLGPDTPDDIACWDCRLLCLAVPRARIGVLVCDCRAGLA
jgi:hypothetical protein